MPYTATLVTLSLLQIGTLPGFPPLLAVAVILALGLLLGSFLNVCIARLPRHESIAWPGSRCRRCLTPIRAYDNIPLVSFLLLRGRCRACREPIAWHYPAVELATALLFLLSASRFALTIEGASAALLSFLLLGLLAMDAETLLLPDAFTLPGLVLGVAHAAVIATPPGLHRLSEAAGALLAATLGAALVLAIRWTYWLVRRRHGMGLGDVKLVAMIAAWLGVLPTLLVFVLATLAAAGSGLARAGLAQRRGNDWRSIPQPFGAFLCGAGLVVLFAGQPILDWYLGLFP